MTLREVMDGEEGLPSCSVCGAVVKDGKCLSCGEPMKGAEMDEQNEQRARELAVEHGLTKIEWDYEKHEAKHVADPQAIKAMRKFATAEVYRATKELQGELDNVCVTLRQACDREWKDETAQQIATIAANAIHWRGRHAIAAETALAELKEYEAAESAFMAKNGVLYNCTFVDGWQAVLNERDELRTALAEAKAKLESQWAT